MASGINPALWGRGYRGKNTGTGESTVCSDVAFHQSRCSGNHFKGRTGCRFIHGCIIDKRTALVGLQLGIIFRINGVCHFVVVVGRVRYTGKRIPGIDIRNDHGAAAGVKCQFRRRNIQVTDTVHEKIVGGNGIVVQPVFVLFVYFHTPLFTQKVADVFTVYDIGFQHVFEKLFLEIRRIV